MGRYSLNNIPCSKYIRLNELPIGMSMERDIKIAKRTYGINTSILCLQYANRFGARN